MSRDFEERLKKIIEMQKLKLMRCAEEFIPNITEEDIMQPNDFPILESHPFFRHEEGILEGLLSALAAFQAQSKENLS
ncbi:MAG: hypothetical protein EBU93_00685 [Chlamydiae bacterium]|jgi:hypothetical protein|nr:hypothetical protein [Chlamydiota bacterium]